MIKAMGDVARALIFAAQWPMLRGVAVRDMAVEPLFNDAMLPEKPTVTDKAQKYPNAINTCRHPRGPDKVSSLKKYGTSVGTLTLCDKCGPRWVLSDGRQVPVAPKLGPNIPTPTGLHRKDKVGSIEKPGGSDAAASSENPRSSSSTAETTTRPTAPTATQ